MKREKTNEDLRERSSSSRSTDHVTWLEVKSKKMIIAEGTFYGIPILKLKKKEKVREGTFLHHASPIELLAVR